MGSSDINVVGYLSTTNLEPLNSILKSEMSRLI